LTTAEIASAFLVPEATMGQRISRAKQRIRVTGISFRMPRQDEWDGRLRVVLRVLYLIFNEGYTVTSGPELQRTDLTAEAIRLTRAVHDLLPDDEVAGLLALMLLTDARRAGTHTGGRDAGAAARAGPVALGPGGHRRGCAARDGDAGARAGRPIPGAGGDRGRARRGPRAEDTDWPQILGLYDVLERLTPGPVVRLNRAVAVGMVHGPRAAL
jgi:predicted RNA polymerase sigma factor